jgi:hypothetical protein
VTLPVAASPSMNTKCRLLFSRFLRIRSSSDRSGEGGTGRASVLRHRSASTRALPCSGTAPAPAWQHQPDADRPRCARFRDFILLVFVCWFSVLGRQRLLLPWLF